MPDRRGGTMRAIVFYQHGGPEVLEYRDDIPISRPVPDEVLVRVHHAVLRWLGDIKTDRAQPASRQSVKW